MDDPEGPYHMIADMQAEIERLQALLRDVLDVWQHPDAHDHQSVAKIEARIRAELGEC